ncbi:YraN family protein [Candidatus Gottesmanbacteria bacterium]|nr:YraN family protein [Candidatus Gottesmanbacteria bacterium]
MDKQDLGKKGEELAARYLQSHGYRILTRNFRSKLGEIDAIGLDGKILVFIEVKTRWSKKFGPPEEAVTSWKLKSIIKTAQYFKMLHPELPESLRIDVVAISLSSDGGVEEIRLLKNVTG